MAPRILLLASHAIAEYDDVRMFSDAGFDVFAPGGYEVPAEPGEHLRPALPDAPSHPELVALCRAQRELHAGQSTDYGVVDWAKADLHPGLIEWADVIIAHHFVDTWLGGQWDRIRHKRVIWRTCGQSNPRLEYEMGRFRADGLEIVRYSPAERRGFEPSGVFAGEDALIRFGKYPEDYGPWVGDDLVVGNVTQNLDHRGDHCGLEFWKAATNGLPVKPAGTGSERLPGGIGELSPEAMREYLRHLRAYLYMGTQPASYTLALIEAMLSGVPVVSIGPDDMWMPALFEGHELAGVYSADPRVARQVLSSLLADSWGIGGERISWPADQRRRAIELFNVYAIREQWRAFLEGDVLNASQVERRLAGAAA